MERLWFLKALVRNQTRGRKTLYLDYEAYEEMALQQMESLAERGTTAVPDSRCRDGPPAWAAGDWRDQRADRGCLGSSGGRLSTLAAGSSTPSSSTVPIWKKEYFEDGAVWADGEPFPAEIRRV